MPRSAAYFEKRFCEFPLYGLPDDCIRSIASQDKDEIAPGAWSQETSQAINQPAGAVPPTENRGWLEFTAMRLR